jgi:hypothetical protein
MAKTSGVKDQMVNIVYQTVVESGANTLTFAKFETGYGTLDRVGWIINRIEYYPTTWAPDANTDAHEFAITTSNQISALGLEAASVKHFIREQLILQTAVGWGVLRTPIIVDLSTLPGNGILVLPNPLYIAVKGTGCAGPITLKCRLYFQTLTLDSDLWMELVEQTRLLS